MAHIHPLAIVHSEAQLASDVEVGPFCTIGAGVKLGTGNRLMSHVVIEGDTTIGEGNVFYPFAAIGLAPQDKKYANEPTRLTVGDQNVFRENVTIHRGTTQDKGLTSLGSRGLYMAGAHVAHDCVVGDDVILANAATLGGHVHVGNWAIIGGLAAVHQFSRVGEHVMIGGCSCITQDVAPYVIGHGNPFAVSSVNVEGLRRRGFSAEAITGVRSAFKTVFRSGLTLKEAIAQLESEQASHPADVQNAVGALLSFIQITGRGLAR